MEPSKNLPTVFNSILPFSDFLYILQQEEYSSQRYWKWLGGFFFRRNFQIRGRLLYTTRTRIIFFFAILFWLVALSSLLILLNANLLLDFLLTILLVIAIPFFVLIANIVSTPFFAIAKQRVIKNSADRVNKHNALKIIAVAGSFGKTTTKNFIYELIRYNYKTQLIPENINTTLVIAYWVNQYLSSGTQVLIVEMDTYKSGEIAASCTITPPDIAIITNIGDQHLERFRTKERLAQGLSEVFTYAKPSAQLLCNPDTAKQLSIGNKQKLILIDANAPTALASHPDIIARFSASNIINLAFAIKTAELLGVSEEFIIDACKKLELPDRRQKMTMFHGYECVDDSYNISFTTAQAGIAFARSTANERKKKLLVVTAGIPELGPHDRDKNEMLGKILASKADCVALLKSIFYKQIERGIFDPKKYILFKDLDQFLKKSKERFPTEEWLLLLQPELTDLYY